MVFRVESHIPLGHDFVGDDHLEHLLCPPSRRIRHIHEIHGTNESNACREATVKREKLRAPVKLVARREILDHDQLLDDGWVGVEAERASLNSQELIVYLMRDRYEGCRLHW